MFWDMGFRVGKCGKSFEHLNTPYYYYYFLENDI